MEVLGVLQDLVERRCLMKCQEEDRALWVLNFGWEGEEDWDEGEILRFFDGGDFFPPAVVVVKMKQPRWTKRMRR